MTPVVATVAARRREGAGVCSLEIDAPGVASPAPGQFNMLTAFGVGESAISLSAVRAGRLVHTIRAVGPVTRALAGLRPGQALGLRGPFGLGWPMAEAVGRDVVILAGGLGLAPLRPVLRALASERRRYGQVVLLYGARSPHDILYERELERLRRRLDLEIEVTVDHAGPDWRGHVGVVTTLLARFRLDPATALAFICGPEIMMRFAAAALKDAGLPDGAIHLSMERNMRCAVGQCGHCQFGPVFVCRDGPVFRFDRIAPFLGLREF